MVSFVLALALALGLVGLGANGPGNGSPLGVLCFDGIAFCAA